MQAGAVKTPAHTAATPSCQSGQPQVYAVTRPLFHVRGRRRAESHKLKCFAAYFFFSFFNFLYSIHAWLCGVGASLSGVEPVYAGGPARQEASSDGCLGVRNALIFLKSVKLGIKCWQKTKPVEPSD